jgi:hypothetical protein
MRNWLNSPRISKKRKKKNYRRRQMQRGPEPPEITAAKKRIGWKNPGAGKGSERRLANISEAELQERWDLAFGKKTKRKRTKK